jgi:hypothetical protein
MSKRAAVKKSHSEKLLNRKLMAIPMVALLVKLLLLPSIPNNAWIGADGENYVGLSGFDGMNQFEPGSGGNFF